MTGGCKREGWRGGGMRVRGVRVMGGCRKEGWRGGGMRDEGEGCEGDRWV